MHNPHFKLMVLLSICLQVFTTNHLFADTSVSPIDSIRLPEAHKGTATIDTRLMDSYGKLPENRRQFYLSARSVLTNNPNANISTAAIVEAAREANLPLIAGPMLGDVSDTSIALWFRAVDNAPLTIKAESHSNAQDVNVAVTNISPGAAVRTELTGLLPNTSYTYEIVNPAGTVLGKGSFRTAPKSGSKDMLRIAFGSCFHKIGVHNPNLMRLMAERGNRAVLLLGDLAVDDRDTKFNMHYSDYLLRDTSKPWRDLSANIPVYASWDDHDYLNNDKSGLHKGRISDAERNTLRLLWQENWVNPQTDVADRGIYFSTSIGDVDVIMLDTRSCRDNARRGKPDSYLGIEQKEWLFLQLKNSTAKFIIITSGTMWSDYISNGKDSWGTWDREVREEIFTFIENHRIGGVLLLSGDRHGARGFKIPRPSGFAFYEFEPASLGGVRGPGPFGQDKSTQLFGYGKIKAFGEFTFDTTKPDPDVTFRLISETGDVLETHSFSRSELTPSKELTIKQAVSP